MSKRHTIGWSALALLVAAPAFAAISGTVELNGKVSDFDAHYVFINAPTERYRVKRAAVPDSVELRPGVLVDIELPLDAIKIIPATAPINTSPYKPPRKRTPAEG